MPDQDNVPVQIDAEEPAPFLGEGSPIPLATEAAFDGEKNIEEGSSWYRDRYLLPIIATVFIVDQVTKLLVRNNLRLYESWPEEGPIRITRGLNTGTAFGLLPDQTTFLIIASIVAIGFLYFFYRTQVRSDSWLRFAIALQLGGALGNLSDRVFAGAVTDFIDVGPWPIFNIADSSIVIGIVILLSKTVLTSDEQEEHSEPDPLPDQVDEPHSELRG